MKKITNKLLALFFSILFIGNIAFVTFAVKTINAGKFEEWVIKYLTQNEEVIIQSYS